MTDTVTLDRETVELLIDGASHLYEPMPGGDRRRRVREACDSAQQALERDGVEETLQSVKREGRQIYQDAVDDNAGRYLEGRGSGMVVAVKKIRRELEVGPVDDS